MTQILQEEHDDETYGIIGAAMQVHRSLRCGFLEAVYQEALAIELAHRGIPFTREVDLPVTYRGHVLACSYRADFVCFGSIIVELKSILRITALEEAQVINYLKATNFERAILLNFGRQSLEKKRLVRNYNAEVSSIRKSAQSA